MAVVFWKMHHEAFNALACKTSLNLAAEKYAETNAVEDLEKLQRIVASRQQHLSPCQLTPLDIVVARAAETGCSRDLKMLQTLVKSRSHRTAVARQPLPKSA